MPCTPKGLIDNYRTKLTVLLIYMCVHRYAFNNIVSAQGLRLKLT